MKADKSGMLVGYPLHDSELISISYRDSCSHLVFRSKDRHVAVELNGITYSGFKDFKFDAILSEIFVWQVDEVPSHIIDIEDGAWRTLFPDLSNEDALRSAVNSIRKSHNDSLLVQLNYSYGGSFAVICAEINISS